MLLSKLFWIYPDSVSTKKQIFYLHLIHHCEIPLFSWKKKPPLTFAYCLLNCHNFSNLCNQVFSLRKIKLRCFMFDFTSLTNNTLEIRSCTSDTGLSLPDATRHSVKSTDDVLNLMKLGELNRVVTFTAMNNRSSRSHR